MKKKNNLENNVISKKYEVFETVEDLLKYLEISKKVLIEYSIKNDVSIEKFSNGYIKMNIAQNIHQDFIMGIHKLLEETTGKKWEIDITKGELGQTIADKEKSKVDAKKKNVAEYPLVKKILEEFKGAKIETIVRKNLSQLSEEEPDVSLDTMSTYFDEEE